MLLSLAPHLTCVPCTERSARASVALRSQLTSRHPSLPPNANKKRIQSTDAFWSIEMENWALIQRDKRQAKEWEVREKHGKVRRAERKKEEAGGERCIDWATDGLKMRQKGGSREVDYGCSDLISMADIMMVSLLFIFLAQWEHSRQNRVLGSGQWAMRRAIKGSLPSPAITELLLRRNYLGNETNLKLTACGKPDVHYMGTLWHTHIQRHTRFGLIVLAVSFPPIYYCTSVWVHTRAHRHPHLEQTHQLMLGKMRRRPINPSDSYLFVCLTLPVCHLFSFISWPPLLLLCVSPSICSFSHVEMLSDTVTPVCTLELVSYEQSLTWNAILETHTLSDSSKTFFAVDPPCNGRWVGKQFK